MKTGATHDPTRRFSERVSAYVRYRPGYPAALIGGLLARTGAREVADIGSGTGIFTRLLLAHVDRVFAVEPNAGMRAAAEAALGGETNFVSITGTAEQTGLTDRSVDLVTAAQAFHWFDNARAKAEFRRILRPGGWLALIWNRRRLEDPFQQAYHDLLERLAPEYPRVNHARLTDEDLAAYFADGAMQSYRFDNGQDLDIPGLIGRLRSASYCPAEGSREYRALVSAIEALFTRHARDGRIKFSYDCRLYLGPMSA